MAIKKPAALAGRSVRAANRTNVSQAAAFRQTRLAHARETAEDYAEAIADLIAINGEARIVDIANRLGISHVSVVRTVARLQREGLVSSQPYRAIFLTDKGVRMARESRQRHEIVVSFLKGLGISDEAAHTDAEGIEHHVSAETLAAFVKHLRKTLPHK